MKLTRQHLTEGVFQSLTEAAKYYHPASNKFSYAVKRNIDLIRPILADIQRHSYPKPTKELEAFNKDVSVLMKQHQAKDDQGEPVYTEDGRYVPADMEALSKAQLELLDKHPEAKKQIDKFNADYAKYMRGEVDVTFHVVTESNMAPMPAELLSRLEFMSTTLTVLT
jgi:hypothetical protein